MLELSRVSSFSPPRGGESQYMEWVQDESAGKHIMLIESILQNVLRCATQEFFAAVAQREFGQQPQSRDPDCVSLDGLQTRGQPSASALFVSARGAPLPLAALQRCEAFGDDFWTCTSILINTYLMDLRGGPGVN